MLVLTRKTAESIHIGNDVVIKVISCGRGRVKIGIDAPTSVRVVRAELADNVLVRRSMTPVTDKPQHTVQPVT